MQSHPGGRGEDGTRVGRGPAPRATGPEHLDPPTLRRTPRGPRHGSWPGSRLEGPCPARGRTHDHHESRGDLLPAREGGACRARPFGSGGRRPSARIPLGKCSRSERRRGIRRLHHRAPVRPTRRAPHSDPDRSRTGPARGHMARPGTGRAGGDHAAGIALRAARGPTTARGGWEPRWER